MLDRQLSHQDDPIWNGELVCSRHVNVSNQRWDNINFVRFICRIDGFFEDSSKQSPSFRSTASLKLKDSLSACLLDGAATYDVNPSILLTGPEGAGLEDTLSSVAKPLGFHVLSVNTYELVGETEAKTEKKMRDSFDLATYCAPCVLFLRGIDALALTTEAVDANKGFNPL